MLTGTSDKTEEYWPSISDLMSGLMLVFLLIAIAYMHNVEEGQKRIKKVAVAYQETQVSLYNKLMEEFDKDLPKWKARIDKETLSVQFMEPEVLFHTGSFEVTDSFKAILDDFFPRYLRIIFAKEYEESIDEIRIEGHTSSEWGNGETPQHIAYFNNMNLSQDRTRSVLQYCFSIIDDAGLEAKMRKHITANGLSSSRLVLDSEGREQKQLSRRVEFRTRTNAEQKIVEILEQFEK
ncbi:OmpA/MotB domain protein [Alkalidesulfovibrio alkalitolerans DSM 16529]|uniref:OmpA/MotB domain protein n=1 Tax=Alkalidesulfovibrio alkalitolerans DSM 16529 TaxID=1121439 RepID=S7T6V1_9BACT|nr:OmpA family protein [Alkalidesulfovibrio alkalitolerans]EPR32276.1 OmpA/MotB domain protein [Alkalidesulfovibrio alkalitolerans DSM 16529]